MNLYACYDVMRMFSAEIQGNLWSSGDKKRNLEHVYKITFEVILKWQNWNSLVHFLKCYNERLTFCCSGII